MYKYTFYHRRKRAQILHNAVDCLWREWLDLADLAPPPPVVGQDANVQRGFGLGCSRPTRVPSLSGLEDVCLLVGYSDQFQLDTGQPSGDSQGFMETLLLI